MNLETYINNIEEQDLYFIVIEFENFVLRAYASNRKTFSS